MFIDLKPYVNPAPHIVSADTSLHKARAQGPLRDGAQRCGL